MRFSVFFFISLASYVLCSDYGGLVNLSQCSNKKDQIWIYESSTKHIINYSGKCLDVQKDNDSYYAQLYTCSKDSKSQQWTYSNNQIIANNGYCLSSKGQCSASGSLVNLQKCGSNEFTYFKFNGQNIVQNATALCVSPLGKPTNGDQRTPLIIGHRGFPASYPENTIVSFKGAIAQGIDGIETDLRLTKDGKIVISHDESLSRTTNCTGKVQDFTYDYIINNCDAGSKYGPEWAGNMVPDFESVVKLCKDNNVLLVMDMKVDGLANEIKRILDKYDYHYAIASMWYQSQLEDMRSICPNVPRQRLSETLPSGTNDNFSSEISQGVMSYSLSKSVITSDFIYRAHKSLMSVIAWTVDDVSEIKKFIREGINGIITNDCETAKWVALDVDKGYYD